MQQNDLKDMMDVLKKRYQIAFRRWLTGDSPGHNRIVPYIGADREFVKQWISERFVAGMEWSNYGTVWVVTHIVPLRFFDFTNDEDLKIALHYKNVIPLFKEDCLYKENAIDFSLKLLESIPSCEITEKLKSILLIEPERLNKYLPKTGGNPDIIFLNSICFEVLTGEMARLSNRYKLAAGNNKHLTAIDSNSNNKTVKEIKLERLNIPTVRIDKNMLYVEMWAFSNESDDNNRKRLNIAFINEMKRRKLKLPDHF